MDKELVEYLQKMEARINERFDNLASKVDETKKIVEAVQHGQEILAAKVTGLENSMEYVKLLFEQAVDT